MTPRDVTPEPAERPDIGLSIDRLDADRLRIWAEKLETHGPDVSNWSSYRFIIKEMRRIASCIDAAVRDIGELRSLVETAQREVVLMAQSKVGEHCEHHQLPLVTLEYYAMRECPLCWKAAAEEASAELSRLRAVPPATPPADRVAILGEVNVALHQAGASHVVALAGERVIAYQQPQLAGPPTAEQEPPQMTTPEGLADRLEKAASGMVARQIGRRTGSLRRAEAIELELLLRDAAAAISAPPAEVQNVKATSRRKGDATDVSEPASAALEVLAKRLLAECNRPCSDEELLETINVALRAAVASSPSGAPQ